jgi:predicted extracellular nuclease
MKKLLFVTVLIGFHVHCFSQDKAIRVMFYNVENLFDTIDSPDTFDEDFTPQGKLSYSGKRYQEKLAHLAKVIDSSFVNAAPSLLGLCEVENENVVKALRDQIAIPIHLAVVHHESPDQRGIDNALLYDSLQFSLIATHAIRVDLGEDERPTRDILMVHLQDRVFGEELAVFVNHWPSRYGGEEESAWKRMKAAQVLAQAVDSVQQKHPNIGILVMGDLNDHPNDASVLSLEACDQVEHPICLTNVHSNFVGTSTGSHAYKGSWGVLDQILINNRLRSNEASWHADMSSASFVRYQWMLYHSERDNADFPSRSYGGTNYYGGFSDHLPAILVLRHP